MRAPNSVMMMEVQESPFEAAPALEEAAILYANRQDAAARSALEEAVATEDLPAQAAKQAWMMLFDLFENQGRRADFDAAALRFAVRFETSPPAFNDRAAVKHPMAEAGGGPQVALTGRLDESASKKFEHLRIVAGKNRALKVDFSKVDGINDAGAAQLRLCLAALVKSGHEVAYTGADHLTSLLVRLTEVGRADFPQAYWLLLLDLYQIQNLHAQFEEAALSYCITYEVSPPSWMDPRREPAKPASRTLIESESQPDDAFYLKGEIEGGSDSSLKGVGEFAADKQHVVIDVFHVKRMDFIAAGSLLNLVSALKASGKHVEIRSPSPLLANLFVTMGFTECARLARRKT